MSKREEVLSEFGTAECVKRDDCTHFDCVAERRMADEIVRLRQALKHETQWADAGAAAATFWQQQRDELLHELSLSRLAHEEQDKRLAAVEAERDAALKGFERRALFADGRAPTADEIREQVAMLFERAERAERILDALREPSAAVVDAAEDAMDTASATDCVPGDWNTAWVLDAIRAAVAAAEQKVSDDTR